MKHNVDKSRLVVVAGPTASGKSDLAIELARRFGGEIVSADSRQVYRGMDIGTGKVTKVEQRLARHWLLDVASPTRAYTVAQWRRAAERAIRDIASRGKVPIICGGTGFWIDALVYGRTIPEVKPDPKLRARLAGKSTDQLFVLLKRRDPRRAKTIDRHNRVRLIRALEIVMTTGKPVPEVRSKNDEWRSPYEVLYLGVMRPWEALKERIEMRLDARLRQGMVAEARRLHDPPSGGGVSWKRMEALGLEYRWLSRFLTGTVTKEEMRSGLLTDIIHYAKRQMTWWKKNPDIRWVKTKSEALRLTNTFLER
jgi:tRNA dimethylallyltransferase